MKIIKPTKTSAFTERNIMLNNALRPPLPFSIDEEYPLVLNAKNNSYSHCMLIDQKIVAHANLWPRSVISPTTSLGSQKIGLIGNVVTHPEWQNKGLMACLLQKLEAEARLQKLQRLILWSDLRQFYQKMGYTSFGQELRLFFNQERLPKKLKRTAVKVKEVDPQDLSNDALETMFALRPPTPLTLQRSLTEFRHLLSIPATHLFISTRDSQITGYGIVGKGYDMYGVLHEWGIVDPKAILLMIKVIITSLNLPYLIVLSPLSAISCLHLMKKYAYKIERHGMSLSKSLTLTSESNGLFIWGLDSI